MNKIPGSHLILFRFSPSEEAIEDPERLGQEAISQCHSLAFCTFCSEPSDFLGVIQLPNGFVIKEDAPFKLWFGFCDSCGKEFGAERMKAKVLDFYFQEKAAILS